MKSIQQIIEGLSNKAVTIHHAKLVLEAPSNSEDTFEHETTIRVDESDEIDHLCKVIALNDHYTLTGDYKLSSEDLMKSRIIRKEFTSTRYDAAISACASATGLTYQKIRDAMSASMNKFVELRLEYGLKEFIFFKKKGKTYIGVMMRVQEAAGDDKVKYFVQISVPVY